MPAVVPPFDHGEDKAYFASLFGGVGGLFENSIHFDFRDPKEKRAEFNRLRNGLFRDLVLERGNQCELRLHPDCTDSADEVDHLVPLSSNVLNKLRGIKAEKGRKVRTQSLGSNHPENLVLACRRCNASKKHRLPDAAMIHRIKGVGI